MGGERTPVFPVSLCVHVSECVIRDLPEARLVRLPQRCARGLPVCLPKQPYLASLCSPSLQPLPALPIPFLIPPLHPPPLQFLSATFHPLLTFFLLRSLPKAFYRLTTKKSYSCLILMDGACGRQKGGRGERGTSVWCEEMGDYVEGK